MKRIAVIGAGATGHALAAILSSRGHEVTLADTEEYASILAETEAAGKIQVSGRVSMCAAPHRITTDVESAVAASELIICCTVSNRDAEVAALIAPQLTEEKAVLIGAGNGASIVYHKIFTSLGQGGCLVGEVAGNFFPARLLAPGKVRIGLPLSPKGVASCPPTRTRAVVERFHEVWELTPCANLFEPLFNGPNLICHAAGIVANLAAIDSCRDSFNMFKQGMSPAVLNLTDGLWEEKAAVYRAMGCTPAAPPREFLSNVMDFSNPDFDDFREMDGPNGLDSRYITEDVPYLLCFFVSIARKMGVPVPLFEGIVHLISKAANHDYYREGRTLENLGLGDLSREELIAFFSV